MRSNASSFTTEIRGQRGPDAPRLAIVFLHGTRLSGAVWAAQVEALSGEFDCVAPDLPGHGAEAGTTFTIDAAAERVAALIDSISPGRPAVVVGLSLGGYVAMTLAARWPERVAGLAISGATAEPVGIRALGYRALGFVLDAAPEAALDAVSRRFFAWRFPPEISGPILERGFSSQGGATALRSLVGERFRPRLAAYPGPSLLINGEYDLFFRRTEGAFARAAAQPRRVLIRRATHLVNLDQPAAFSAVVRRFARSIG
jgi:pimeloyl-ACP methyl ester carboxylesterase